MANVLIIEDSSFQRKILRGILTELNHNVTEAVNGIDGMEKIKSVSPDLIFLDLLMPEKDGIEVLTELKGDENSIPVIVLSADIQESIIQKCYDLGASDFINKPAKKSDVENSISKVLN